MSYYKFTSSKSLSAWDAMNHAEKALREKGKAFAELFGGKPVFKSDLIRITFFGVKFPAKVYGSEVLWTKPTSNTGYSSWPKSKAPKGMQAEHKDLADKWSENHPSESVSRDEFLQSVGLDWGILILTGCEYFRWNNAIYFSTGATPKPEANPIEILGSEFKEAREAIRQGGDHA